MKNEGLKRAWQIARAWIGAIVLLTLLGLAMRWLNG